VLVGVDGLAALLDDLAVGEEPTQGHRAPADAVGGLVDGRMDAVLDEAICAREPGDACADHNHPVARASGPGGALRAAAGRDQPAATPAAVRRTICPRVVLRSGSGTCILRR
jgi:hypothetical protein